MATDKISVGWLLEKHFKVVPQASDSTFYVNSIVCVIDHGGKFEVGLINKDPHGEISLNPSLPHIDCCSRIGILYFMVTGKYL
jgi:hypothetical protein